MASNHLVHCSARYNAWAADSRSALEAFLPLARGASTTSAGSDLPRRSSGPGLSRGLTTIERHRQVLDPAELGGYDAGSTSPADVIAGGKDERADRNACRKRGPRRGHHRSRHNLGTGMWKVITSRDEFRKATSDVRAGGLPPRPCADDGRLHEGHIYSWGRGIEAATWWR